MKSKKNQIQELVRQLYTIVRQLERIFPGRHFTPDGHLVGSIGEVVAASKYKLTLLPPSNEKHDARKTKTLVQIKTTQANRVALNSRPEHLLVFKLGKNGATTEIYNGPGNIPWKIISKKKNQKNGQRQITLSRLCKLNKQVLPNNRLSR